MKNYTIKIQQIFTSNTNFEGEIKLVGFIIEGTEDKYSASCYGEVKLNPATPENFVELKDIEETKADDWCAHDHRDMVLIAFSCLDDIVKKYKKSRL